jgi:ABC-type antimicrobial peptide transport system permease subunit
MWELLHRAGQWHEDLHADMLDGYHAEDFVRGPDASTVCNLPCFNATDGTVIQDSGLSSSQVLTYSRDSATPELADSIGLWDSSDSNTPKKATLTALKTALGVGGGDVVGPASATDNAAARYNTTTGKLIQSSDLIINDVSGSRQTVTTTTGNTMRVRGYNNAGGNGTDAEVIGGSGSGGSSTGGDALLSGGDASGNTSVAGDVDVLGGDASGAGSTGGNANVDAAQFQISNLLRLRHRTSDVNADDTFTVRTQQDALEIVGNITGALTIMLAAIAGISLLVGGIGIMNIMLVSVTERTSEIGLRKAIGASPSDILTQFTIEAVILSLLGGAIGTGIGVGGILFIAAVSPLQAGVSIGAICLAVGVSGGIGLFFGIFPARQASRLDPIVALRSI